MRVSRLNYESLHVPNASSSDPSTPGTFKAKSTPDPNLRSLLCAVFDGHGGELCADLVSNRLYAYLAISILSCNHSAAKQGEAINASYLEGLTADKFAKLKEKVIQDIYVKPELMHPSSSVYDEEHWQVIRGHVRAEEQAHLVRFTRQLNAKPVTSISEAIRQAFIQCDADLSEEIERNLSERKSKLLTHYYFSLAASGSCVSLLYVTDDRVYVASSGDCKAILSLHNGSVESSQLVALSNEHDADNLNEIRRLIDAHPQSERNYLLKNNRLLGQLMPLRAFGDFCYKWSVEKMQKVGLTRAFGPHIIPPNYYTPPYLIVDPEINEYSLSDSPDQQKFIVLATDGLWEQFANVRQIMKTIVRHQQKLLQLNSVGQAKPPATKLPTSSASKGSFEPVNLDTNSATYLLRNALGQTYLRNFDAHIETDEILRQQHERLVSFLTLPQSVVRNFRDDISVIVLYLN
jgi:pyruvate dehydrogenase phosphatase